MFAKGCGCTPGVPLWVSEVLLLLCSAGYLYGIYIGNHTPGSKGEDTHLHNQTTHHHHLAVLLQTTAASGRYHTTFG